VGPHRCSAVVSSTVCMSPSIANEPARRRRGPRPNAGSHSNTEGGSPDLAEDPPPGNDDGHCHLSRGRAGPLRRHGRHRSRSGLAVRARGARDQRFLRGRWRPVRKPESRHHLPAPGDRDLGAAAPAEERDVRSGGRARSSAPSGATDRVGPQSWRSTSPGFGVR
jgi:hypothetical protein